MSEKKSGGFEANKKWKIEQAEKKVAEAQAELAELKSGPKAEAPKKAEAKKEEKK